MYASFLVGCRALCPSCHTALRPLGRPQTRAQHAKTPRRSISPETASAACPAVKTTSRQTSFFYWHWSEKESGIFPLFLPPAMLFCWSGQIYSYPYILHAFPGIRLGTSLLLRR